MPGLLTLLSSDVIRLSDVAFIAGAASTDSPDRGVTRYQLTVGCPPVTAVADYGQQLLNYTSKLSI